MSPHTLVKVTQDQASQDFIVHTDLLALHSGNFRTWLIKKQERRDDGEDVPEDEPYVLNRILHFTHFVSWLYTRSIFEIKTMHYDELEGELWDFGAFLEAPGFQNCLMDRARKEYENEGDHYMRPDILYGIYLTTKEDSLMRILATDIMGKLRVMEKLEKKTKKGRKGKSDWNDCFKNFPDMKKDSNAALIKWNEAEGYPWNKVYRARYLVEERPLDELWEGRILTINDDGESLYQDIYDKFKKDTSIKGRLLFDHLDKMKTGRKSKASTPVS